MSFKQLSLFSLIMLLGLGLSAQDKRYNHSKFKQLQYELSTPNVYRTASGAPGHMYWQQQADYVIAVTLDDENQRISGEETITYHNNSPDALSYLWVQLDQNMRAKDSDTYKVRTNSIDNRMSLRQMNGLEPIVLTTACLYAR